MEASNFDEKFDSGNDISELLDLKKQDVRDWK